MFDKKKTQNNNDEPLVAPPTGFSATKNSSKITTIGPSIRIRGEIAGGEDLIIQGNIDGTINLANNNLTIGENGDVKATTYAHRVTVKGNVTGDIMAAEKITITQTGGVTGNLTAPRVILEDGSKFKGQIDMSKKVNLQPKEKPAQPAAKADSAKISTASPN